MNELQTILNNVQTELGFTINHNSRERKHVYARSLYFKAARQLTDYSFKQIGKIINKNHATVIHGIAIYDNVITFYEPTYVELFYRIIYSKSITVQDVNLLTFGVRY